MKRHQRRPAKAQAGTDPRGSEFNQMIHLKMIEESERHFSIIEDLALVDGDSGDKITAYARDVIAATDIVLGAYPKQEAPEGVAMWIIKGRRAIVAIFQDGRRDQFCAETCRWDQYSITAIPARRSKWPFTPMRFLATAHGSKSGVRGQLSTSGIHVQPAA